MGAGSIPSEWDDLDLNMDFEAIYLLAALWVSEKSMRRDHFLSCPHRTICL